MRHPSAFLNVAALELLFKFDRVDERACWVLEDDQLVRDYAVDDLLLLALGDVVDAARFVELRLAAMVTLLTVKHLVDADGFFAALVLILGAEGVCGHLGLGRMLVVATETHLSYRVKLHATFTFDEVEVGPDLPVDLFPGDAVGLSHERDKFLQVPILVDDVLCSHLAVMVDEACAFSTAQHLPLLFREQLVAVGALIQVVFLFLQKQLELLHEEPTHDLVFALLQNVEAVQADFLGHLADDVGVDTGHVDLHPRDFLDVLSDEVETLTDESVDFEELCGDENGHGILNVELGTTVLHDG